jgi:hypothetical protein
MIELNSQNIPTRLSRIVGWTVLSLLFIGAIIALKQEFRSSQSAGEAVAAADDMPKDQFERRVRAFRGERASTRLEQAELEEQEPQAENRQHGAPEDHQLRPHLQHDVYVRSGQARYEESSLV